MYHDWQLLFYNGILGGLLWCIEVWQLWFYSGMVCDGFLCVILQVIVIAFIIRFIMVDIGSM